MAWYYGTFSCKHEGRVNIIGPVKDRQWKADRRFEGLCEECYKAMKEREREEANNKALEAAKEMELPELTGTEKQISWATTLRNKKIEEFSSLRDKINNHERMTMKMTIKKLNVCKEGCHSDDDMAIRIHEYLDKAEEILFTTKTKASYWIDSRYDDLNDIFEKIADEVNIDEVEIEVEKELISEATVSPEEIKFEGVVEITSTENKIDVKFEKNETFRDIAKSLGYKWENRCWTREIKETTGTHIDRTAELGNKLLNAGFSVAIQDEEIREKAIKGDYEPECDRWIYKRKSTTKLAINWKGMNDTLYNTSRKLLGARWDNSSMLVDVSHFEQVEEFAELYGFKFTKSAMTLIEKYKEELENVTRVSPAEAKKKVDKNGLKDILNSSREVINDLIDED